MTEHNNNQAKELENLTAVNNSPGGLELQAAREEYMKEAEAEAAAPLSKRTRTRKRDRLKALLTPSVPEKEGFPVVIHYLDGITGTATHSSGFVMSWSEAGTLADRVLKQTGGTLISITPFEKE